MDKLTLDYFINENNPLYQHKDHFHFNTDTKLLSQFMKIKPNETILDIGTNNGALLSIADQYDVKELIGVEVLKESSEIAKLNAETFFKHPTKIINQPIQNVQIDPVEVIISNPPFFTQEETHPDMKMNMRQMGRVELNLSLEELIQHANRLLKSNGRFYFVHRPNRIQEIITLLNQHNFAIKSMAIVYDKKSMDAKSLLIEAIKEAHCRCQILPPQLI